LDSQSARKLADALQAEVCNEIHKTLLPLVESIIRNLNAMGHHLIPSEIQLGEIAYQDVSPKGCVRLRLACDTVISSGYAHMSSANETPDEIINDVVNNLKEVLYSKPKKSKKAHNESPSADPKKRGSRGVALELRSNHGRCKCRIPSLIPSGSKPGAMAE
jgi:hypothetical protein